MTVFFRLSIASAEPLPKRTTDVVTDANLVTDSDVETDADVDKPATTLPGEAHGIAKREEQPGRLWLWPLRVALFVPRLALEIMDAPIRGALWAYEGYDIGPRSRQIFFNEDGTIGMYPVAFTETGFGLNVGLRFVHRELFGKDEKLNLRASFGGRYRQLYRAKISSGERWPFEVVVKSELEIRPKDAYFGVGHSFDAVRSRFSQTVSRSLVSTNIQLAKNLSLEVGGAYTYRKFNTTVAVDDGVRVLEAYPDDALVGIDEGISALSSLTRLSFDTRRSVSQYESAATPSLGWLMSGFVSSVRGVDSKPSDYIRVGADIQTYQRLAEGPRVLVLRANYSQVIGDREDIPFTDLPRLGGAILGRGFHLDRFRDKASLLLSGEYQFDFSHLALAALFVDYGRVAARASDLVTEIDDYAVGGGMALQFHTAKSFIVRATLAGSQEGLFFNMSFDPQFGPTSILEQN
ncbi:MAG: hypothetical protein JKY56_10270 [Kofleriaceae bacterium]|nr:hypothetical protein [Kofleriaceae bacterium]